MREGFGLIVVEANSQGTPALTFDVNGYRDLIERGRNGFMVAFPDIDALAAKMRDLVSMAWGEYEALCASSLEVSKKYSWDRTAEDVNRILGEISAATIPG
jgi:glycosyltransferase involved in cell wall biosynthesis